MNARAGWLVSLLLAGCAAPPARSRAHGSRPPEHPQLEVAEAAPSWEFATSGYAYVIPDETDYFNPVVTADRGPMHFEARYAYEDLETGSLWAGWNFGVGDELRFDATLMAGWVFGRTDGVAPGYRFSLAYEPIELTSEAELVFDLGDADESFFYSWSELAVTPVEWLRAGVAGQHTRAFGGDQEFDPGILLGAGSGAVWLTVYAFHPWSDDDRFWMVAGDVGF